MGGHSRGAPEGPQPEGKARRTAVPGRRVLVVDDDEFTARSLALILEYEGYEVRVAHDGASALAEATRFRPVAIVSDLGLPDFDGREVARRIRRDRDVSTGLRLLAALTGYSGPEQHRLSIEAGFDHHLAKPVDPQTILALLASLEWCESPVDAEAAQPS